MGKRLLLSLALVVATCPALPQEASAPIQTAQAEEKPPAVEQPVVLPETGFTTGLLIGAGVIAGLALLSAMVGVECDDSSGGCGGPIHIPATTGTR